MSPNATARLDKLFHLSPPPPSFLSPQRFAGVSPESNAALLKTLKADYERWHVFFNDKEMHNHMAHHLLAIYQLGASPEVLEAAYQAHSTYMRPVVDAPEPITEKNFHEHLGNENFYSAYREFFADVLLEKGAAATLEEYVFSAKANIISPAEGAPPMKMVSRFYAGVVHPYIHTGYGAEFGLLGMFAEGLAQTAAHPAIAPALLPASISEYASSASDLVKSGVNGLGSTLHSLVLDPAQRLSEKAGLNGHHHAGNVHALTILARILNDPSFAQYSVHESPAPRTPDTDEEGLRLMRVLRDRGAELSAIADAWTVDGTNPAEVTRKIEELIWLNTIIYGVCGWGWRRHGKNGKFNADFFTMHLVTSVLFVPSLVAYLSPASTAVMLRTYLVNSLAIWVSRGRAVPPLKEFFSASGPTVAPVELNAKPSPARDALASSNPSPNPWLPIIQTTIMHRDEHLCKLQRALAHFAILLGTTEKGAFSGIEGLPGAEEIDGTLFIRSAGLTADALGWMREGQHLTFWDFQGYFD